MRKYDIPQYTLLTKDIPLQDLRADYEAALESSRTHDLFVGRGCTILDATYINEEKIDKHKSIRFAGSSTERAVPNYIPENQKISFTQKLQVRKNQDPLSDDLSHNCVKPYLANTKTTQWLSSLGQFTKITYATLNPNSWWPAHYDFSWKHAVKINIPIYTNEEAVSLSWNQKLNKMFEVHMKEGECWYVNSAFKHTAFNWGDTPRTFLLVTFEWKGFLYSKDLYAGS